MRYFVAVISPEYPKNYDTCKALGLWGMTGFKPAAESAKIGDKILFYLGGGVGFVSIASVSGQLKELNGDDWKPYDMRDYVYGLEIEFIEEFPTPHYYSFPNGINKETGLRSLHLREGFFEISKSQFNKFVKGIGSSERNETKIKSGLKKHKVKSIVGEVINFDGLIYAPINEQGVVFLFAKVQHHFNITIESIQQCFPDARGRIKTDKGYKEIWIEFEYLSSNYRKHGHSMEPGDCDYLVCWKHDWESPPMHLNIIELQPLIQRLNGEL